MCHHKGGVKKMRHRSYIFGKNHWSLEQDLKVCLERYWTTYSDHQNELADFGEICGSRVLEVADRVDEHPPKLVMHDLDGNRVDRALLDPAHRELLTDIAHIYRPPYEGGSWHHAFAYGFLLADPGLYCTLTVTNQTAYAIHKYAPEHYECFDQLMSGAYWGATWMTETQGGSDLGANNTVAMKEGDQWRVSGEDKSWASNAGIADYALITARPKGAKAGPKGLALFLLPRLTHEDELNYYVRRFKEKSATRAVPTGEVEFNEAEAYLIGNEELGIYITLEVLTVARLANAIGAMGLSRKAHLESMYRTKFRSAFGKSLIEHPLIRRDLTDFAVRTAAGTAIVFHAINAFDKAWKDNPPYTHNYHYARFLSHLVKNRTAEHAARLTLLGMELFGGQGFLDEFNLTRLHREALITPIWEGSSNIQALDMLEVMAKKSAHEPFLEELHNLLHDGIPEMRLAKEKLHDAIDCLSDLPVNKAQWHSKGVLRTLADVLQVALLFSLAELGGERYEKLGRLYATRFIGGEEYPDWALEDDQIWNLLPE
jgi:alkylation response protein AidB-like acyl-CoA dehydrogenase